MVDKHIEELDDKSKSQKKRDAQAAQQFGEQIVLLKPAQLEPLDLPEDLRTAIKAMRDIKSHGARKRQKQYIGRLLREIDWPHLQSLLADVNGVNQSKATQDLRTDNIRALVDRLLANDVTAHEDIMMKFSACDRQHLQQLMRKARKPMDDDKPHKARHVLVRYLLSLEFNE